MFGSGGVPADGVDIARFGTSISSAVEAYLGVNSPLTVAYDNIVQDPDKLVLQIGVFCKSPNVSHPEALPGDREECDHMHAMVDMINDKSDGFLDDLLPHAIVETKEAHGVNSPLTVAYDNIVQDP